ncbi:hypothetical protein BsWGS_12997 [Bradybaena similaris]
MAGTLQRHTYYPNPDDNFVIRNSPPYTYGSVPKYLSSSALINESKSMSQKKYNPNTYGEDSYLNGSLQLISHRLNRMREDLRKSLLDDENQRLASTYTQAERNQRLREILNKYPASADYLANAEWYLKPIHLTSPVYIPMTTDDMLATRYFPVTLGEAKSLEMVNEIKPGRERSKSRSRTTGIRQRSLSATSERDKSRDHFRQLDNTFYLTEIAPHIKKAGISFTSPFSEELSKLRMEKLRIEEKQYLEFKRQVELERIRGPKPKWYELKTPEFHYEASKNNELLRNSDKWDELLRYRENLVNASRRLHTALQGSEVPVY